MHEQVANMEVEAKKKKKKMIDSTSAQNKRDKKTTINAQMKSVLFP